jgi:hypothetical protein
MTGWIAGGEPIWRIGAEISRLFPALLSIGFLWPGLPLKPVHNFFIHALSFAPSPQQFGVTSQYKLYN